MRMVKLKNRKAAGRDEVTGERVKGGSDMVVDWIWRLSNMAFKTEDLLCSFFCIRVKVRGLIVSVIEALPC